MVSVNHKIFLCNGSIRLEIPEKSIHIYTDENRIFNWDTIPGEIYRIVAENY